jgi:hypothetical protein
MNKNHKKRKLDKEKYEGPFCCFYLDSMITNKDNLYNVKYDPTIREFYLESLPGPYIRLINFCPWCGHHFAKGLRDEWFDILEKEYGIDDPGWPEQAAQMPEEFKTDQWWKKRNL